MSSLQVLGLTNLCSNSDRKKDLELLKAHIVLSSLSAHYLVSLFEKMPFCFFWGKSHLNFVMALEIC